MNFFLGNRSGSSEPENNFIIMKDEEGEGDEKMLKWHGPMISVQMCIRVTKPIIQRTASSDPDTARVVNFMELSATFQLTAE